MNRTPRLLSFDVQVGDALPDVKVDQLVGGLGGEVKQVSVKDLFAGKKGVLFGVPGAYTPGCTKVSCAEGQPPWLPCLPAWAAEQQ